MSKSPPKTLDEIHQGRTNIFRIPARYVKPAVLSNGDRLNVRDDFGTPEEQDELARSIAEHGIKQPLLGTFTTGIFYYDDGDRRMNAHGIAVEKYGLKGDKALVPIRRQEKHTTDEERTMDLLTLNSGKGLNMYEQAKAMHRMVEMFGKTPEEVARLRGCSSTHVKSCIDLLTQSSDAVRAAVASGKLAATTAADFVHEVTGRDRQEELLAQAITAAEAAGSDKITAKHFSIPLGKKAQESRREPSVPSIPLAPSVPELTYFSWDMVGPDLRPVVLRSRYVGTPAESLEYAFSADNKCIASRANSEFKIQNSELPDDEPLVFLAWTSLDEHHQTLVTLQHNEPATDLARFEYAFEGDTVAARRPLLSAATNPVALPEPGAAQHTDPFAGKDATATSAQVDDRGVFISGIVNRPITFTAAGVSGSIGLALRNAEWFMGIIAKWPGKSKDDGFLKVPPSLKGKAYERNQLAEIEGVMQLRAELESKEFKSRAAALADIDRHLAALIRGLSADDAKLYQAAKTTPLEPGPSSTPAPLSNPVIPPGIAGTSTGDLTLLAILKGLIEEIPAADAEKDRLKTAKYIHGFLAGKFQRTDVAKYLLGVVDKVEAPKKA